MAQHLDHLAFLAARIAQASAEIAARTRPCADAITQMDAIRGVGQRKSGKTRKGSPWLRGALAEAA